MEGFWGFNNWIPVEIDKSGTAQRLSGNGLNEPGASLRKDIIVVVS